MVFLQLAAGVLYLLNKIFLSRSEHLYTKQDVQRRRYWRTLSWVVYLLGLPFWVVIFAREHNWIAAAVELSGAPAMVLGLIIAIHGRESNPPRWLDHVARVCIPIGFLYSLYDLGGLSHLSQWLEISLVGGFLIGTYLLAKEQPQGYLWYVVMHVSCGYLMWLERYPWLLAQQMLSLVFIFDAYHMTQTRISQKSEKVDIC